jgi:hypothetical protein
VAAGRDPDDAASGDAAAGDSAGGDASAAQPKASPWHRLLLALPRLRRGEEPPQAKRPLGERLRDAMLKPVDPETAGPRKPEPPRSAAEIEAEARSADDTERLIGLFAAPVAAALAIVISSVLVSDDPKALFANGQPNPKHVDPAVYHTLELVLLALALGMLGSAWFRKRTLLAITMALYGLGVFNLHYWGFGIPYILGAAWLLVRSYRLTREVREAEEGGGRPGTRRRTHGGPRPGANKRYTPPRPPTRRPGRPKPEGEQRAG